MRDTSSSFPFLRLPSELRVEIYRIAIKDCLLRGKSTDLLGLACCNNEIRKEFFHELTRDGYLAMSCKSLWEKIQTTDEPFCLENISHEDPKMNELRLSLPLEKLWRKDKQTLDNTKRIFRNVLRSLQPAFQESGRQLTITTSTWRKNGRISKTRHLQIFNQFLEYTTLLMPMYNRASMVMSGPEEEEAERLVNFLATYRKQKLCSFVCVRQPEHHWITREIQGDTFEVGYVLDFVKELEKPKLALLEDYLDSLRHFVDKYGYHHQLV